VHANWREGKEGTDDGTERDKNGESTQVIELGDDDRRNELDEPIGVGTSIHSVTASVKFRTECAGPILSNTTASELKTEFLRPDNDRNPLIVI